MHLYPEAQVVRLGKNVLSIAVKGVRSVVVAENIRVTARPAGLFFFVAKTCVGLIDVIEALAVIPVVAATAA